MESRELRLGETIITLHLEPIFWELLEARSVKHERTLSAYLELNAPTNDPETLARWVRTSCVADLRERLALMRKKLGRA